jgi:hypothetical protein
MSHLHDALAASSLRRVIIESPCSGDMTGHAGYLARCLRDSIQRAEAPIASHGLFAFSMVLDDDKVADRNAGMYAGWAWIEVTEAVVVYDDLGITEGMKRAILLAEHIGKPVEYRSLNSRANIVTGHIPGTDQSARSPY